MKIDDNGRVVDPLSLAEPFHRILNGLFKNLALFEYVGIPVPTLTRPSGRSEPLTNPKTGPRNNPKIMRKRANGHPVLFEKTLRKTPNNIIAPMTITIVFGSIQ